MGWKLPIPSSKNSAGQREAFKIGSMIGKSENRVSGPPGRKVGRARFVIGGFLIFWGLITIIGAWVEPSRFGDDSSARWAPVFVFSIPGFLLILSGLRARKKLRAALNSREEQASRTTSPSSPIERAVSGISPRTTESASPGTGNMISLTEKDFPYSACPLCHESFLSGDSALRRLKVRPSSTEKDKVMLLCPGCDYNVSVLVGLRPSDEASQQKPDGGAVGTSAGSGLASGLPKTLPKGNLEGKAYTGPPVRDLTQEAVIQELLKLGLDRETAEAQVEASLVLVSTWPPALMEAVCGTEIPLAADNFVLRWAVHCVRHGAEIRRIRPKS